MNTEDKTCKQCGRFYRGAGHKGFCTRDCYLTVEFAVKHDRKVHVPKLYSKPHPKECPIAKANAKWLSDDKPKPRKRRKQPSDLTFRSWEGNQYKAVRG